MRVTPRASATEVMGERDGVYRIRLTAPAAEGKANRALVKLLSKKLRIPKGAIEIVSGGRARTKAVRIGRIEAEEVKRILSPGP